MEQNYSEQGSLMWLLWGSLAVGVVFNQAPGLDSQQASDLHYLWRLEFTEFKWSILSYLSLSSAAFTTVWVQLTLLIHTEYTLIKWTHSAHKCSWERSSTKSAKERRDKKSNSSDEGKASNLVLSPLTHQEKHHLIQSATKQSTALNYTKLSVWLPQQQKQTKARDTTVFLTARVL